jgi:uncharacterized protein (TIGR02596 family)
VDAHSLAGQTARTKNQTIEARFYKFGSSSSPAAFRGLQLFEIKETGNAVPLGKVQRFPARIIADSNSTLSPLIGEVPQKTWSVLEPQVSLPDVGMDYTAQEIRFRPDGSLSLSQSPQGRWFITLHNEQEGDSLATPPKNYFTVQVDAANGRVKIYRP